MQYLFFSKDNEFMLERLASSRVFLYERKRDFKVPSRVKWVLVHRFT